MHGFCYRTLFTAHCLFATLDALIFVKRHRGKHQVWQSAILIFDLLSLCMLTCTRYEPTDALISEMGPTPSAIGCRD